MRETNRPLFEFLGMTVGVNVANIFRQRKKKRTKLTSYTEQTTSLVLITS